VFEGFVHICINVLNFLIVYASDYQLIVQICNFVHFVQFNLRLVLCKIFVLFVKTDG
jgi:hypothetical protein